ncbi:hypothetical protein FISHEDRAFT_10623, partial [Fistulina hepatica ATCC 64428]
IDALLKSLRESPVENPSDVLLARLYGFLMSKDAKHWFCNQAEPTIVEVASFLLRLFAYNNDLVTQWKTKLDACLNACADCVHGLQSAKTHTKTTYFGAFPAPILSHFWNEFEKWEKESVLKQASGGVTSTMEYRILTNFTLFCNPELRKLARDNFPLEWTYTGCPAGVLLLLFDDDATTRARAQDALKGAKPMSEDDWFPTHQAAVDAVMAVMGASDAGHWFEFVQDRKAFWVAVGSLVALLPLSWGPTPEQDIRRAVISHLHDTDPEFTLVLSAFLAIVRHTPSSFWRDQYPQVVFDSLKDNPEYLALIQASEFTTALGWFPRYLAVIEHTPVHYEVLAKMLDFSCGELQHERFGDLRPAIMGQAIMLLVSVLKRSEQPDGGRVAQALRDVLDIHGDMLASVAFGTNGYNEEIWQQTRTNARSFIESLLRKDSRSITATVQRLCEVLTQLGDKSNVQRVTDVHIPKHFVHASLWNTVCQNISPEDRESLFMILSVAAEFSYLAPLNQKAFRAALKASKYPAESMRPASAFEAVNQSLNIVYDALSGALDKFVDQNTTFSMSSLMSNDIVVEKTLIIMLSPVDRVQKAALALVKLVYDVDDRLECFRSLFENRPTGALNGTLLVLSRFRQHASTLPEACAMSQSVARCYTDVIEVLCTSNSAALKAVSKTKDAVHKLWTAMTKAIAIIFKRTPSWAEYFESTEMLDWMRDALIFGRDLVSQWKVFERGANGCCTSKTTTVGERMVMDLQEVTYELTGWLRLTNEETLYQAFELLRSLLQCFYDTHIPPSEPVLQKFDRRVKEAREQDKPAQRRSRLDLSRVLQLEEALSRFREDHDSDVVEIVEPDISSRKVARKEAREVARKEAKETARKEVATKAKIVSKDKDGKKREVVATKPARSSAASDFITGSSLKQRGVKRVHSDDEKPAPLPKFKRLVPSAGAERRPASSNRANRSGASNSARAVSSSDSDDSEDEQDGNGLADLVKLQRSPHIRKPPGRRTIQMYVEPRPATSNLDEKMKERAEWYRRQQRRAHKANPDLSDLYRAILSWDYKLMTSDAPPSELKLAEVPDEFMDFSHYIRVFKPLLLADCYAQIASTRDDPNVFDCIQECKIDSRSYSDTWLLLSVTVFKTGVAREWNLTDTDVVLLRKRDGEGSILAKVNSATEVPGPSAKVDAELRCYIGNVGSDPLQIGSTWDLVRVYSLSTINREFAALVSVPYYDLPDDILRPRLPSKPPFNRRQIDFLQRKYKLNEPQAVAVNSTLITKSGFVLIQGPPGTGKTSTMAALVPAFLSRSRRATPVVRPGQPPPDPNASKSRILLAAASNAAVDEAASRLKNLKTESGRPLVVVRTGSSKSMSVEVADIAYDKLVEDRLSVGSSNMDQDVEKDIRSIHIELEQLKAAITARNDERKRVQNNEARFAALDEEIKRLSITQKPLRDRLDSLRNRKRDNGRRMAAEKRRIQKEVLNSADVICSTLSGTGHKSLDDLEFDLVIIDEAAQAIELSSLIPLRFSSAVCVFVGDPQQLPPTVISMQASRFRYNQSLFVRLQKQQPDAVHLLSIQYRMHPDISLLPSRVFYGGRLQDGPDMATSTAQAWHAHQKLGTYRFFNVASREEQTTMSSMKNVTEARTIVSLFRCLRNSYNAVDFDGRIGIVTGYRGQVRELKDQFIRAFGNDTVKTIHFNTVDGFQGQEKDIIIFSCVRAGPGLERIGFMSDTRRMNVALTRARSSLFIVGNAPTLERSDKTWADIVKDARERNLLTDV